MTAMKVLVVTAMYPTLVNPAFGSFVRTQVKALQGLGVDVNVLVLEGRPRQLVYLRGIFQLRTRLASFSPDLVHAHYGYVGMVARTQWQLPLIVTYHGTHLLGTINTHGTQTQLSRLVVAAGRVLSQFAVAVIVQTDEMAKKLDRPDVYVVPCEIDLAMFCPQPRDEARIALRLDLDKK